MLLVKVMDHMVNKQNIFDLITDRLAELWDAEKARNTDSFREIFDEMIDLVYDNLSLLDEWQLKNVTAMFVTIYEVLNKEGNAQQLRNKEKLLKILMQKL